MSFPYEWSFGHLKDAALLTLEIARRSIEHGLVLKDASAFNVQFRGGRPVFIDTLSFESYVEGRPWVAYRQFCQHFLAPLVLMTSVDPRLGHLSALHLDGVPLDLASRLLPRRSWLRFSRLLHIHLHARSIARYAGVRPTEQKLHRSISRTGLLGLLDNLDSAVRSLRWKPPRTEWSEYEKQHSYSSAERSAKEGAVRSFLTGLEPALIWDLGANTGAFSRIAAETGADVVSIDGDPVAVEWNYRSLRSNPEGRVLPLVMDLTNPTPALGWANRERQSLAERGPADLVMALALIHHLALSNNVPLSLIAKWFRGFSRYLIVEFVPKSDPQAQRLLVSREDIFPDYSIGTFEDVFAGQFEILQREDVSETGRVLFLMKARLGEETRPSVRS